MCLHQEKPCRVLNKDIAPPPCYAIWGGLLGGLLAIFLFFSRPKSWQMQLKGDRVDFHSWCLEGFQSTGTEKRDGVAPWWGMCH